MVIDKRFERAQASLDKMYTNVAQNINQITAKKKKQKQQAANQLSSMAGRYLKETAQMRQASNEFAQSRDMNPPEKQQFSDNLAAKYNEGYTNIQNFIKEGNHSDAEIQEYVSKQINHAGNLSKKILSLEGISQEYAKSLTAAGDSEGKNTGSAVVGSPYQGILNTMTDNVAGGKIQWNKMKLTGNLDPSTNANNTGMTIFFDAEADYEDVLDDKGQATGQTKLSAGSMDREGFGTAQSSEILSLDALQKNYESGNKDVYLQIVKDDKEIYSAGFKASIKATNKTKSADFTTEVVYEDENGNMQKKTVVDKGKRQDYFINGEGQELLNTIVNGNETMLVQKYFGAQAAAKIDEPMKEQDLVKLKVKILERLDPDFDEGDQSLIINKSTTSKTFTKNTNSLVVKDYYKKTHEDVRKLISSGDTQEALKEYNREIQDRPYSFGGKTYTIDHMELLDPNKPGQYVLVSRSGQKITPENASFFDLNDVQGQQKLETGIMKGNFQGTTDRRHVDGYVGAAYAGSPTGGGNLDDYKGDESSSTRISGTTTANTMSYEDYKALDADKKEKLSANSMDWSWQKSMEPEELSGLNKEQIEDREAKFKLDDQTPAEQGLTTSTQDVSGATIDPDTGIVNRYGMKYAELSDNSFGGGEYDESGRVGDKAVYTTDASGAAENTLDNQYRKIINFETVGGATSGSGVGSYGFTDAKYNGKEPKSPEEAVEMIKKEIVPQVEQELGFSLSELDQVPPQITASLVDYKMNTGRKMDDLLLIAYQNQGAMDGEEESKAWDGISAATQTAPKPTQEIYDALKTGKITPEAIASAKDELYVGRIKYMRDQLNKKPADRDGSFRSSEADYKNAVQAYRNSHSNRVNMFR